MADTAPKDRPPLRPLKPEERAKAEGKPKPAETKPRATSRPKSTSLEGQLRVFIAAIGSAVMVIDAEDGVVILDSSEEMASAWTQLANQNPRVKRALERVISGGAWGGVIMVHASVILRIAQNHGIIGELTFPIGGREDESAPSRQDGSGAVAPSVPPAQSQRPIGG